MKTLFLTIFLVVVALDTANATPPYFATTLWQQNLTGLLAQGGNFTFTLSGLNVPGTGTNNAGLYVDINEGTLYTTPSYATNATWTITGSLIPSSTNLQVAVTFTCSDTNNAFGATSIIFTNVNSLTNTLYLWEACDFCGTAVLTNSTISSPTFPMYDAYGAAYNATNGYAWLFYRSNAWSLASVTNGMHSGDYRLGNSNGVALVGISMSNGVVRLKQFMP